MASIIKESFSGYLKKDFFMLRLELRIKCPSNESVTFDIHEWTVFCKVNVEKVPFNREKVDDVSGTSDMRGR